MMQSAFDRERSGTGTKEWAERTENIQRGCRNDCLYCYAAAMAHRFRLRERSEWALEELTQKAQVRMYPKRKGVVMFPSAHDVTPFNTDAFISAAKVMLAAGNRLLVVTKPDRGCMRQVMNALEPWKDNLHLRFTIGAIDPYLTHFWEPGAPHPLERLDTLADASGRGFAVSVSIEPMLAGVDETLRVVENVLPWSPETVWIGKMNKVRARVPQCKGKVRAAIERIEAQQSDGEILRLVEALDEVPQVRWKDSIVEVAERCGKDAS